MKYIKPITTAFICQLMLFPYVCEAHGDHGNRDHGVVAEKFQWTQEKSAAANIIAQVAGPGMIQHVVQVSGRITTHPDHLAYVIPQVEGIVRSIYKNVGDQVEVGEVIALVESKEVAAAKAAYLSAVKKAQIQHILLQKESKMRKISAEQDYLNAQIVAETAALESEIALQHLYALGFDQEEVDKLAQENSKQLRFYKIRSPISGKVIQRNLTLGESLEESSKVFTIANFDKVWVEINVAQNDAHYLKEGLTVDISSDGNKQASARICHFSPTISEETRKSVAIAILENKGQTWRPGEFITAYIQADQTPVSILVPREAVQLIKGEACIFVENAETGFAPRVVKLGKMDATNVEIIAGLQPGDTYAASNVFCLKADYEKEECEHHH